MNPLRLTAAAALAACFALPAFAQDEAAQCILAGRLSDGQWAPHFAGVTLLGADGRAVTSASRDALANVKQARLARPALLSRCDGDNPLANADNEPAGRKERVPGLSAGVVDVEALAYPKLRTGGELVELRVRAAPQRVVMITR